MYSKQLKVALRGGKMILVGAVGLVALGRPALAGQSVAPTAAAPPAAPTDPVPAQPPTEPAVAPGTPSAPTTVVPKPGGPVETSPTPAESKLFLDAIKAMKKAPFAKVVSTLKLSVVHGTGTLNVDENLSITGGRDGQYRSDIQMVANSKGIPPQPPPHEQYTVASDGKKLIVYRHGNDTYAVTAVTDTKDGFEQLAEGLVFSMKASKDTQFTDFDKFRQQGNIVTVTAPKADEPANDKVLHLMSKDGTLQARLLLDPTSGRFDEMQLVLAQPGTSFILTERVTQLSLSDSSDPSLFQFTPPHGAKKVPSITIANL